MYTERKYRGYKFACYYKDNTTKDLERYNIYLDEKYAFSVHETILVKFELTKGMTLEDWSIGEMVYEDQISKAFNRALHYLGFQMRSEFEVKQKLLESRVRKKL